MHITLVHIDAIFIFSTTCHLALPEPTKSSTFKKYVQVLTMVNALVIFRRLRRKRFVHVPRKEMWQIEVYEKQRERYVFYTILCTCYVQSRESGVPGNARAVSEIPDKSGKIGNTYKFPTLPDESASLRNARWLQRAM